MISLDVSASPASAHTLRLSRRIAPALYSATLFVSALLLFTVQPMFTKMVLPRLGGSPSVWSVAMVAFQTFLFAGYAYAHLVARLLRPAQAAALHLAFLSLVALTLILFRGVIDRPGWPSGEIGIGIGWFVALLGGLLILLGALTRTYESTARRKPPGML